MTSRLIKIGRRIVGSIARLSSRSRPPIKIVFLHIPKTGGLSILSTIKREFPYCRMFVAKFPPDAEALRNMTDAEVNNFDVIAGHFGGDLLVRLRPPRVVFTCVRDPIERIISLYDFLKFLPARKLGPGELGKERYYALQRMNLKEFIASPLFRSAIENVQCRQLIGASAEAVEDAKELAARAIERLREIDAVFTTQNIDRDLPGFLANLGIQGSLERRNRDQRETPRSALSAEGLSLAREVCQADLILFNHIKR
jgi:hypothetical protein